jgi:type VI secretion system secreted protein VgrG
MEGDPDRPLITGRVYNEEQQVPYKLPDKKTVSTLLSRSSKGGSPTTFNEIRMEDLKGSEQMFIHSQKDRDDRTKEEKREFIGKNSHLIVKENQKIKVESNRHTEVKSNEIMKVGGKLHLNVGQNQQNKVGTNYALDAGMEVHIKAGMKVVIEAGADLTVKGPGGFININPGGIFINGTMVYINSGGSAGSGSGCTVDTPETPDTADDQTKFTKL